MLFCCCDVNTENGDFISPPTTVKARENNTVLLPCYLNTLSNGEFLFNIFYENMTQMQLSLKWTD